MKPLWNNLSNGNRRSYLKWLYPGMEVKRWLGLMMLGITIISLGAAYILRELYSSYTFPEVVWYLTLQFLPRYLRGILFFGVGIGTIGIAITRLNKSLLSAFIPPGQVEDIAQAVYNHRQLKRGLKIVAIGGGTGLSALLKGLKEYTGNLTAIVTVADDGGSSGRLRRELGVLPPGDFRNCIAALADSEALMTRLLQYRFGEGSGLKGHSFGNLFIVAMSGVVGSFEEAIKESCRVLAVRGQILPSTLANVTLSAHTEDNQTVRGESNIPNSGKRIKRVYLEPEDALPYPEAIRAIEEADLIVIGPGSLYTSILPNLLVGGLSEAIRRSSGTKMYVCNVATQPGETDYYTLRDHTDAITRHVGEGMFQYVLANGTFGHKIPAEWNVDPVYSHGPVPEGAVLVVGDLVSKESPLRHDPDKLSTAIIQAYYSRESLKKKREEEKLEVVPA
ncbi:MAG: YvcK family protein [Dehalococcoidia bacterium]|nr:YvcK family protein [Dehalococcoidia bacterium]